MSDSPHSPPQRPPTHSPRLDLGHTRSASVPGAAPSRDQLTTDLRAAVSARDAAIQEQQEVAALFQTQDLRRAEEHLQEQAAELHRLHAEIVHIRRSVDPATGEDDRIQGLQIQVSHQARDIQDLKRHLDRAARTRARLEEDNERLTSEVDLAETEIQDLQEQRKAVEQDRDDSPTTWTSSRAAWIAPKGLCARRMQSWDTWSRIHQPTISTSTNPRRRRIAP
ncbi:uncharacterized protein IUM83_07319 [Phytophthora cinnamomi]|uniref:uncharacterized protein n=1 Tax=Phytophthora cinnamomi TaxID=4785 RepID=UPI00355A8D78|nr:hypothetical protein IUM83_07319 [Phytophthora cinnamomi]